MLTCRWSTIPKSVSYGLSLITVVKKTKSASYALHQRLLGILLILCGLHAAASSVKDTSPFERFIESSSCSSGTYMYKTSIFFSISCTFLADIFRHCTFCEDRLRNRELTLAAIAWTQTRTRERTRAHAHTCIHSFMSNFYIAPYQESYTHPHTAKTSSLEVRNERRWTGSGERRS